MPKLSNKIDFIKKAQNIHGNKYNYDKSIYKNANTKLAIYCKKCNEYFNQIPNKHINFKQGCRKCTGLLKLTLDEFIKKSKIIHKEKYDYSKVNYINAKTNVIIICNKCKIEFLKTPDCHMGNKESGCPHCSINNISKSETKWLDSLNIPLEYRNKFVYLNNNKFKPDALDPINKIIYEFNGDFWHGNPKIYNPDKTNPLSKITYGKLYQNTLEKEKIFKENGYKIITIWESEWNKIK